MTNIDHNTAAAPVATLAPWHVFAADYRERLAAYDAAITDSDNAEEAAAQNSRHDAQRALWEALLAYPVATLHQLAEKAELIVADCWDDSAALGNLAADALIVAHGPDRREWLAAVAAYEAARTIYDPVGDFMGTEEEAEAAWRVYHDAWTAMVDCPAPDAAATAYKIAAFVDVAYAELLGDAANNPVTLRRMLEDTELPGSFGVVRFMQDACRQAGVSHACLSEDLGAESAAD